MAPSDVAGLLSAACAGVGPLTDLAQALNELGAYRGLGRDNAIARHSAHVIDALPKSAHAGPGAHEQLAEKAAAHSLLLQVLADSGVFGHLHASVLRCLFEDGQRLAALSDVQQLESELERGGAAADAFPLAEVVAAAGAACKSGQLEGERDDQTICWSTPTASLTALFAALAEYATSCGREPGRAAAGHHAVHQLSRALVAALGGMRQQRMQQAQYFPAALNAAVAGVDEPELAAGADVRIALGAMADACCRLQPMLAREAPGLHQESVLLLFDITDRLLNTCAAAVAAAPPGQQRRQLHEEYAAVREKLLGHLLLQADALRMQDEEQGDLQVARVRGLAEAHAGWSALFDIAGITGQREQLYAEMSELRGDGLQAFAPYVFGRLLREGRQAELLDLPLQFDDALHAWLSAAGSEDAGSRQQLLWLHEIRMQEYGACAATLGRLMQAHGPQPRLVALQKLAALTAAL